MKNIPSLEILRKRAESRKVWLNKNKERYKLSKFLKKPLPKLKQLPRKRKLDNEWRQVILNHFGNKCNKCGNIEHLEIHHINPVSNGGENILLNLEILCNVCHGKTHSRYRKNCS